MPYVFTNPLRTNGNYLFANPSTLTTNPELVTASISTDGTKLQLRFDRNMRIGAGGTSGVSINTTNGKTVTSYSATTATVVEYNIDTVTSGETVTVTYAQPGNGLEALSDAADVLSFTAVLVSNFSTVTAAACVILQDPSDKSAGLGASLAFIARATIPTDDASPVTWQWQRNGEDISGATGTSVEIPGIPPSSLTVSAGYNAIAGLTVFNGDLIRCKFTTAEGAISYTDAATVTVTSVPQFTADVVDNITETGFRFSFSFNAPVTYYVRVTEPDAPVPTTLEMIGARDYSGTFLYSAAGSFSTALIQLTVTDLVNRQGQSLPLYVTVVDANSNRFMVKTDTVQLAFAPVVEDFAKVYAFPRISTFEMFQGERKGFKIDFAQAASKLSSALSFADWEITKGNSVTIGDVDTITDTTSRNTVTASGTKTGVSLIKVTGTMRDGQKMSVYVRINVLDPMY